MHLLLMIICMIEIVVYDLNVHLLLLLLNKIICSKVNECALVTVKYFLSDITISITF